MTRTRTHNEEARQPAVQAGFGSFINSRTAKCEAAAVRRARCEAVGMGGWAACIMRRNVELKGRRLKVGGLKFYQKKQ